MTRDIATIRYLNDELRQYLLGGGAVITPGNDPDVWSGRASQEVFVDLAVSGLASMYSAL
jgi:hypothetical protein